MKLLHSISLFILIAGLLASCGMVRAMETAYETVIKQIDNDLKKKPTGEDPKKVAESILKLDEEEQFESIKYLIDAIEFNLSNKKKKYLFNTFNELYELNPNFVTIKSCMYVHDRYSEKYSQLTVMHYLLFQYFEFTYCLKRNESQKDELRDFIAKCLTTFQEKNPGALLRKKVDDKDSKELTITAFIVDELDRRELFPHLKDMGEISMNQAYGALLGMPLVAAVVVSIMTNWSMKKLAIHTLAGGTSALFNQHYFKRRYAINKKNNVVYAPQKERLQLTALAYGAGFLGTEVIKGLCKVAPPVMRHLYSKIKR